MKLLDLRLLYAVLQMRPAHHRVVHGIALIHPAAQAAGCISLRIQIRHQYFFPGFRQRGGKIDGGGRLPDAALLVCDCNDLTHEYSFGPPVRA